MTKTVTDVSAVDARWSCNAARSASYECRCHLRHPSTASGHAHSPTAASGAGRWSRRVGRVPKAAAVAKFGRVAATKVRSCFHKKSCLNISISNLISQSDVSYFTVPPRDLINSNLVYKIHSCRPAAKQASKQAPLGRPPAREIGRARRSSATGMAGYITHVSPYSGGKHLVGCQCRVPDVEHRRLVPVDFQREFDGKSSRTSWDVN